MTPRNDLSRVSSRIHSLTLCATLLSYLSQATLFIFPVLDHAMTKSICIPEKYKFPKGWRWALTFKFYEIRFSPGVQFKRTLLTSWINILLVCVPTGLTLQYVIGASPETFVCNYLAQIPLWFMCDYALEEIEFRIGRRAVDLVDIFTTNTVQIISSIILLKSNQVPILQTSLVGGILSNLLVLLGVSLLFGGVTNHQQSFNRIGAQGSSSLLSIAATSLLIPTAVKQLGQTTKPNLVLQSRGVAVVLLFVYLAYTYCQMVTHKVDYQDDGHHNLSSILLSRTTSKITTSVDDAAISEKDATIDRQDSAISEQKANAPYDPTELHGPHLHGAVATFVFVVTIVLLYFCIDATVGSIYALTTQKGLSETFVALILLPIPNCDFAPISLAIDDCVEETMKVRV